MERPTDYVAKRRNREWISNLNRLDTNAATSTIRKVADHAFRLDQITSGERNTIYDALYTLDALIDDNVGD